MDKHEGVTRIARALSILGWVLAALLLLFFFAVGADGADLEIVILVAVASSVATFVLFQGLVWIIDGFIGNKGENSSVYIPKAWKGGKLKTKREFRDW